MSEHEDMSENELSDVVDRVRKLRDQVKTYADQSLEHQDHGAQKACNLIRKFMETKFPEYLGGQ